MQSLPFDNEPQESGSVETVTEDGKELTSFSKFSVYGGYVYDRFYGQVAYSKSSISNQIPDYEDYRGSSVVSDYGVFELRAGMRFSDPGDSSYNAFFLGYRSAHYSTDYLGLDVTGSGLVSGVAGFYSLGCAWDVEFVFSGELYVANYYLTDIEADFDTSKAKKKATAALGASVGVGVQYEPYNITCMLKGAFDYDQITHESRVSGAGVTRDMKMGAFSYGFEVSYRYYNYKHNR